MYLMTTTRHGVAAKELQRQLGCTYKTAWRMAHELRKLMQRADYQGPLGGTVEIDETYVGGKVSGAAKSGRGTPNKTIVMGMVERDGIVRAAPIPDVRRSTMEPIIERNVEKGANVFTDEHHSYKSLRGKGFRHFAIKHGEGQYVRDSIIHTNTIEGFWSRLKLSIRGTHIHVSRKHLAKYVSEFAYRYNNRHTPATMFSSLVSAFALPRLRAG